MTEEMKRLLAEEMDCWKLTNWRFSTNDEAAAYASGWNALREYILELSADRTKRVEDLSDPGKVLAALGFR